MREPRGRPPCHHGWWHTGGRAQRDQARLRHTGGGQGGARRRLGAAEVREPRRFEAGEGARRVRGAGRRTRLSRYRGLHGRLHGLLAKTRGLPGLRRGCRIRSARLVAQKRSARGGQRAVNARAISPELLYAAGSKRADLAVIDVSFISLAKVLPACLSCLDSQDPEIICLVKPQFEAGREAVGKGGVVRDPAAHVRVLESVLGRAAALGLQPHGLTFSPLTGPAGNIEYLVDWQARGSAQRFDPTSLVGQAFETLKRR